VPLNVLVILLFKHFFVLIGKKGRMLHCFSDV